MEFTFQHNKNIKSTRQEQTLEHHQRMQNVPSPPRRFSYKKYLNQLNYGKSKKDE